MRITTIIIAFLTIYLTSCQSATENVNETSHSIVYNLIEPGNGIYKVISKSVKKDQTKNKIYEAVHYENDNIIRIERHNENGKLSDDYSVAAVTQFEYDSNNNLKYLRYFDSNGNKWEDDIFGYWSIEYIYDNKNRIVMEIYRDSNSSFLEVPLDQNKKIITSNFIPPILTYEYLDSNFRIKAFDKNFNLLKEVIGDKPCVPFIDCGDSDK